MVDSQEQVPVALFAYNRPEHTMRTLSALAATPEAAATDLIVFCDGPGSDQELVNVNAVRDVVRAQSGFKSVQIHSRDENVGLARSITEGISRVLSEHPSVIVMEDDIVCTPGFLSYMNHALSKYQKDAEVWHVSGWNYPDVPKLGSDDAFFWHGMNCWGWGTWADRWAHFERDPHALVDRFTKQDIERFNVENTHNFWSQVQANASGKIRTWAVFWYATIFQNNGLCLNPVVSHTTNIGFDGTGLHCGPLDFYASATQPPNRDLVLPEDIAASAQYRSEIRNFYQNRYPPKWKRAYYRLQDAAQRQIRRVFG